MSERVMGFGNHGNAQATRTGDAGGTATTLAVSRARAVHSDDPEANRMTEKKPTTALSPMFSNDRVEGRDAALSRRVPSHDGLCCNGSKVGAGDTAMKGKQ